MGISLPISPAEPRTQEFFFLSGGEARLSLSRLNGVDAAFETGVVGVSSSGPNFEPHWNFPSELLFLGACLTAVRLRLWLGSDSCSCHSVSFFLGEGGAGGVEKNLLRKAGGFGVTLKMFSTWLLLLGDAPDCLLTVGDSSVSPELPSRDCKGLLCLSLSTPAMFSIEESGLDGQCGDLTGVFGLAAGVTVLRSAT